MPMAGLLVSVAWKGTFCHCMPAAVARAWPPTHWPYGGLQLLLVPLAAVVLKEARRQLRSSWRPQAVTRVDAVQQLERAARLRLYRLHSTGRGRGLEL